MPGHTRTLALSLLAAVITPAAAQPFHPQRTTLQLQGAATRVPAAPYLIGTQAAFAGAYPVIGANADGTDLWPCVNYLSSNPDCPTTGNPAVPLPGYGLVTGFPTYSWALHNTPGRGNGLGCDALVNGSGPLGIPYKPCAQVATWYEDATGDSTDDLLWRIRIVQGSSIVYDSGTIDYGPAGPLVTYPVGVVLTNDANLGYWPGAGVGPNNGNCFADTLYPLASPTYPGRPYSVASNRSCAEPQPGTAQAFTQTILATPAYTQASGRICTSKHVASPCYTVAWTKKYEIHQNFGILLQ